MANEGSGLPPFSRPRAVGGLALIGLAIVLTIIDSISPEYTVDSLNLGLILGTGSILLGVEAIRRFIH